MTRTDELRLRLLGQRPVALMTDRLWGWLGPGLIALVGGFDFQKSKFNHVTQAWRQPGSSFKPFIYSAALEKGLTPMTVSDLLRCNQSTVTPAP